MVESRGRVDCMAAATDRAGARRKEELHDRLSAISITALLVCVDSRGFALSE
jgi:hypothetical protein